MNDDVVTQEELQRAIDLLTPAAQAELTACVYRVRLQDARKEIEQLRHCVAIHEENARIDRDRPPPPPPPSKKEGAAAAARRTLAAREAASTMAAINGEVE